MADENDTREEDATGEPGAVSGEPTQAQPHRGPPADAETYPQALESLVVLGLIALTVVSCWLLYGRMISAMLGRMREAVFGS